MMGASDAEENRKAAAETEQRERRKKFFLDVENAVAATQAHAKAQRVIAANGEAFPTGRILSQALAREIHHLVMTKPEGERQQFIEALVDLLRGDVHMVQLDAAAKEKGFDLYA